MDQLDDGIERLASGSSNAVRDSKKSPSPGSSANCRPIDWPELHHLRLADAAEDRRRHLIGGSDANIILSGDHRRIRQLWLEKRAEAQPQDLSSQLPAMLGSWTEAFNRQWYQRLTGRKVTRVGDQASCSQHRWRQCTLDGVVEGLGAVFEAKHTSAFATAEQVLERYMPQLQHNMAVAGYERASLSVIFGNHKFEIFEVAADWLYQNELLNAEQHFWHCVLSGGEPIAMGPPPTPRPIGSREVCLEGNNLWASAAFDWLRHREAAKLHATACTAIKNLVEDDVSRAFGHGIEAKRSKSGAITIREFA